MSYFQFRRIHWVIILCCFFLPSMRGCQNEIIIPVVEVTQHPNWITFLIYLYPLFLLAGAFLVKRAVKASLQFTLLWGLLYALGAALSVLFVAVGNDPALSNSIAICGSLVLIWGIFYLALARSKTSEHLMSLAAFTLSSVSLWFFPITLISAQDILIGGWIFMYGAGVVVLSYPMQFLRHANH